MFQFFEIVCVFFSTYFLVIANDVLTRYLHERPIPCKLKNKLKQNTIVIQLLLTTTLQIRKKKNRKKHHVGGANKNINSNVNIRFEQTKQTTSTCVTHAARLFIFIILFSNQI